MPFWEEEYAKARKEGRLTRGTGPREVVKVATKYLPKGENLQALDLGAGEGQNSIHLAKNGFHVIALEKSPTGVQQIKEEARKAGLEEKVRVLHADIKRLPFGPATATARFDSILATGILHFLNRQQAEKLLRQMEAMTKPGGLHIIAAYTTKGDFYEQNKLKGRSAAFFDSGALKEMYARKGWKVLYYGEKMAPLRQPGPHGERMKNTRAFLIARKPV